MVNPIELLLRLRNEIGPQVAEAQAQVAGLSASVESAEAKMASATVASSAMGTALVAAMGLATAGALALGTAMASASQSMLEMGERAEDMKNAGYALSDAQEQARQFYENVTVARERVMALSDTLAKSLLPELIAASGMIERFTTLLEKMGGVANLARMALGTLVPLPMKMAIGSFDLARSVIDSSKPENNTRELDYVHGPAIEDWLRLSHRDRPERPGRASTPRIPGMNPQGGAWGAYGPFAESGDDSFLRMQNDARALFSSMKTDFDKLTPSVARLSPTVMQASVSIANFAASAVTDFGHVGSAFKNMIRDILADIARQQVAKGIGSLIGAFVGGVSGGGSSAGLGGIKDAATKTMNVHISALSARSVLQDLTSTTGEMRNAYRSIDYAGRLP